MGITCEEVWRVQFSVSRLVHHRETNYLAPAGTPDSVGFSRLACG